MTQCCKYHSGMFRHKVTIQEKTRTSDGQGGFDTSWSQVSKSPQRALIEGAPGREKWGFMRQSSGNVYRMVTRYFSGATAAQRVLWNSKEYGVLGVVDPDGMGQWLEWRISDGEAS